jgi:hypothetical protein
MCTGIEIALIVAGTALSVGSTVYTGIQNAELAEMEADARDKQLSIQNSQLEEDRRVAALQATQQENERMRQARQLRAANETYIAAAGIASNISYEQGTSKANEEALRYDLANIRLQSRIERGRLSDQIRVNRLESQFNRQAASLRSRGFLINAFADAGGTAMDGYYRYATLR